MVLSLLIEEGHAAYGVYWMVLELLRDCPNYKISNNTKSIAWAIHCNDVSLVDRVLHNYGLFDLGDDDLLFSPWLAGQMSAYDDKRKRLQEAGRRGAAKRAELNKDREALATLPLEDREAKAIKYNITQHNITEQNITPPSEGNEGNWKEICLNQSLKVDDELVSAIAQTSPPGHAPGFIAQVCRQYGMGQNVLDWLLTATDNANLTHPSYKQFVALTKRIEAEKWVPKHPANFFLSKINEIKNEKA